MQRFMLKSKIHRARITGKELHYEGSLSLDASIMASANLLPFEKIEVYNVNNGQRFSTYVIPAPAGSGEVQLNGAASRLGEVGDIIIIASYALFDEKELVNFKPLLVYVNEENRILEVKRGMGLEALYDR
ncbi:aspartate 1-decarboxylase [Hydrogenobacter hydrogenophilus]|uniref:Aspartate 1-decarboxylase n=1 Tax=Hydrogenobacter hydrogenophilus TaxID=35835 RepID=A0A285P2U5_9AQUI|nr:aspartate 1-decarboxylase [Hydrogenobacter hydrogenophilus]SNZ16052.1 L-aspartate 1-decarboxylase [Hydrogenobacter hydrogenophilus]